MTTTSPLIAGRYQLGEVLGTGSSGVVRAARDLRLDRAVAIKLVAGDALAGGGPAGDVGSDDVGRDSGGRRDPTALGGRERFIREARSAAGFMHPHVVAIHDAGEQDGQLYLVMELVDGPTLADVIRTEGRCAIPDAVRIADQMLDGLEAAHRSGVVHRDVKPANVLLTEDHHVKLADFGIARRLDDVSATLSGDGRLVGTLRYLAPEQLRGVPASAASDVYAVGVVLYELIAGRPPVDGPTPGAIVAAHHAGVVIDPRTERPDVPDRLATVVMRALQRDPADRYPSAAAMRAALASASAAGPTAAGPTIAVPTIAVPTVAGPTVGDTAPAGEPTELIALPATAVFARPLATPAGPARRRRRSRLVPALFGVVTVGVVGGIAAIAAQGRSPSATAATAATAGTAGTAAATIEPPATAPPTTVPPSSAPPSTAVTTAPSTTPSTAPTTAPTAPTDLAGLVQLVADDPASFGQHAQEIGRRLDEILARNGRKQSDAADRLLDELREWRAADEIDASAADQIVTLVAPIARLHD